ncbi:MAG: hypothetical protein ACT4OX_12490 [Actinomycetota bacterium]
MSEPGRGPDGEVRLHSSWRGLVVAFMSPLLLLAVGSLAMGGGVNVVAALLVIAGGLLLVVSLFDYPLSSTLGEHGITRRTALRRHRLPWAEIDAITRARGTRFNRRPGPLAAACGRRRYLIVDRPEAATEYGAIAECLTRYDSRVALVAAAPRQETVPTWLYHRRK